MKKMLCVTAALLLSGGGAFAADQPGHKSPKPGQNTEAMSAVEDATAGLVGRISAEMTTTTKGFVTAAATSDMYEVAAGKLAAERGSPAVKAFGEKMVKAHTETTAKLKAILASHNVDARPPAAVDNRRQGMLDNLRGASKADFDNRYITQQVAAHKEALALMTGYAKDGDVKAMRDFAGETAKHVRMHLSEAEKLANSMRTASRDNR